MVCAIFHTMPSAEKAVFAPTNESVASVSKCSDHLCTRRRRCLAAQCCC
jgi:hypothetical protein